MKINTLKINFLAAFTACTILAIQSCGTNPQKQVAEMKTITLKSADSLDITTDVYYSGYPEAPVFLLFHQAGYSRGEYREIAPKLNTWGFSCISIDQRSGKGVKDVENETFIMAQKLGKGTTYPDAMPDLEAALEFASKEFKDNKIIIWGSSYSAALSLVLGSRKYNNVIAILAFAPGEYFEFEGRKIKEYAAEINVPVFITSSFDEHKFWKEIFDTIPNSNKRYYLPDSAGYHGSKALWKEHPGHEGYWEAVEKFLQEVI